MAVKVYKFGGASIATAEKMKNIASLLSSQQFEELVIVCSALGKTTNALEKVVDAHVNKTGKAVNYLEEVKANHFAYCDELFLNSTKVKEAISNHFVEVHWMIEDEVMDSYDYCYDQIVSVGELASSTMLSFFLQEQNLLNEWMDARGLIFTDNQFREATVNWTATENAIQQFVLPKLGQKIVVTQGFIGSTTDNETTTLGREGSDFSGAILANCLNAESLTIWKDVEGVLNADPRQNKETVKLPFLTYREAVEMTYYGAKVIHPKTIKPLQNKNIPLHVRPFTNYAEQGTIIQNDGKNEIPKAITIEKNNQALVQVFAKDFSFFDEQLVSTMMKAFSEHGMTINLLQRGAIQCAFVIDYNTEDLQELQQSLTNQFLFEITPNLTLHTLRHYNLEDIEAINKGKEVILEQRSAITYQFLSQQ